MGKSCHSLPASHCPNTSLNQAGDLGEIKSRWCVSGHYTQGMPLPRGSEEMAAPAWPESHLSAEVLEKTQGLAFSCHVTRCTISEMGGNKFSRSKTWD